jgi:hypothetical protein
MVHRSSSFLKTLTAIEEHSVPVGSITFVNTPIKETMVLMAMIRQSMNVSLNYVVEEGSCLDEDILRMVDMGLGLPYSGRSDSDAGNQANQAFYNNRAANLMNIVWSIVM